MAIFGSFGSVRRQLRDDARFDPAFAYVADLLAAGSEAGQRMNTMAESATARIELAEGSFAMEQVYVPRLRPDGFFESHQRYIDVQVIFAGEELMEVQETARLVVSDPYLPERDLVRYADAAETSVLKMTAGDVAVFFPEDGHMPSLRWRNAGLVRKSVVKVPVGPA